MLINQYMFMAFPKTGTTWVQYIIRKILVTALGLDNDMLKYINSLNFIDNDTKESICKIDFWITHGVTNINKATRHDMNFYKEFWNNDRDLITIVRNPCDVLTSLNMHLRYRNDPPLFDGDVNEMVYDDKCGIDPYLFYHENLYEFMQSRNKLLAMTYEQLSVNPHLIVRLIADFIHAEITDDEVDMIVEFCSFDSMKKFEIEKKYDLHKSGSDQKDNNSFKMREGKIGGYKKHMTEETKAYVIRMTDPIMSKIYRMVV